MICRVCHTWLEERRLSIEAQEGSFEDCDYRIAWEEGHSAERCARTLATRSPGKAARDSAPKSRRRRIWLCVRAVGGCRLTSA